MAPTGIYKPIIAAVNGVAYAGGFEWACYVDIRIAEEHASFGATCRRWNIGLADGATQRLPRIVGMGRAMDLILTGRVINADEAYRIGLAKLDRPVYAVAIVFGSGWTAVTRSYWTDLELHPPPRASSETQQVLSATARHAPQTGTSSLGWSLHNRTETLSGSQRVGLIGQLSHLDVPGQRAE